MLGEMLEKLTGPLLQKVAVLLGDKNIGTVQLLWGICGLFGLTLLGFILQLYTLGAFSFLFFALGYATRAAMCADKAKHTKPADVFTAGLAAHAILAATCLFLLGLGFHAHYVTPVCFLLFTWVIWLAVRAAYPTLRIFAGVTEMVLAVVVMACTPVYVPVVSIFVGVLYVVATGLALAQQFLKQDETT